MTENTMRLFSLQMRRLSGLLRIDMLFEREDGMLVPWFDSTADSPLLQSVPLRERLRSESAAQAAPYIWPDEQNVFFAGIHADDLLVYMGPMSAQKLSAAQRRQFYHRYGIDSGDTRPLRVFSMQEILDAVQLVSAALLPADYESEELASLNGLSVRNRCSTRREQTRFVTREEEENDDGAYRHTYFEEQLLMQAIRDGDTEEALRLAGNMDADAGRLSADEFGHRRNLAIIGISLCARSAIEGGMAPETAYRVSGYYIQKCDAAKSGAELLQYRNHAIEELTVRVRDLLGRPRTSNYIGRCKDYVRKHYREKIYLEKVAEALGISHTYLSRIFRRETGVRFQDYVTQFRVERAANLLIYSDMPLTAVAEYVHFPNQSYLGKMFKKYKGITPGEFRDRYRTVEYFER